MLCCAVSHCEASEHRRRALGSPAQLIPKSWSGSLASPGSRPGPAARTFFSASVVLQSSWEKAQGKG